MASKLGTVVTCDNCSETEVWTNAIAALAVDGDTVVLPSTAGTPARWSSQHTLDKAITLQGAGIDSTVILNDFSGAYWILIDMTNQEAGKLTRFTGITFRNGTSTGSGAIDKNGVFRFLGDNTAGYQLRFDHCKLQELKQEPIFTTQVLGVIDHNEFIRCDSLGYIYGLNWDPSPSPPVPADFGDGSWASQTDWAGGNAIYFENNLFDQTGPSVTDGVTTNASPTVTSATANFNAADLKKIITGTNIPALTYVGIINSATSIGLSSSPTSNVPRNATGSGTSISLTLDSRPLDKTFFDGTRGGRLVVRYNTFTQISRCNASIATCHGLENRPRSIRHMEFYNNYVTAAYGTRMVNQRGGTQVIFNNRQGGGVTGIKFRFQADRQGDSKFWGRASGSNPVDVNYPNGGTNSAPIPYFTGVATAGTTTSTIVCAGAGWTPANKWVGYSLSDTSKLVTPEAGYDYWPETQYQGGVIKSSTTDTIVTELGAFSTPQAYASGDNFKIMRVMHAMDMSGRAGTSTAQLWTGGGTAANPPVPPVGWNNQVTEPVYEWNNIRMPSENIDIENTLTLYIQEGTHYFNDTIMPGYPWTDDVPSTCGAEDFTNVALTGAESLGGKGGFTYPHPLVETPVGSKIINVPSSRNFGNVIIGETGTYDIPVTNSGDTTLNVSGITLPTGYVISSSHSFTVAAGATVTKNVVFTPVAETTYSGNIVFASDADSGNGTMAVTGVGVAPAGGGGGGKGHKKGVLVARGR